MNPKDEFMEQRERDVLEGVSQPEPQPRPHLIARYTCKEWPELDQQETLYQPKDLLRILPEEGQEELDGMKTVVAVLHLIEPFFDFPYNLHLVFQMNDTTLLEIHHNQYTGPWKE